MINTSCKLCVFADYVGNKQTDCSLGRIDRYKKRMGGEVIHAYDDEKEFYILDNITCNAYREKSWLKNHQRIDVFAENRVSILVFIYLADNNTDKELITTLKSVYNQGYSECRIAIRCPSSGRNDIIKNIHGIVPDWTKVSVDYSLGEFVGNFGQELNNSIERQNTHYYIVLHAGKKLPQGFLHRFDEMINIELQPIALVKPRDDKYNFMIVNNKLHKAVCGFGTTNEFELIKKIEAFIPDGLKSEMILEPLCG